MCALRLLIGISVCSILSISAMAQTRYIVTDLGSLGQSHTSTAGGINRFGQVSGTAFTSSSQTGFIWSKGKKKVLRTLGGTSSFTFGLNRFMQVVGQSDLTGNQATHAATWIQGVATDLGTLGGTNGWARGINDAGQIVGQSDTADVDPNTGLPTTHGFLWQSDVMSDLGTMGGYNSLAWAIDPQGRVTGQADISTDPDPVYGVGVFHAFVYENGVMKDLGELLGGKFGVGYAIGGVGAVAGAADLPGDTNAHAFIWVDGHRRDMGTVSFDVNSFPLGMNSKRQVVGVSGGDSDPFSPPAIGGVDCPCHATIYQNGQLLALDSLTPPNSPWQLMLASSINDVGQIVGQGDYQGNFRAFLLTPVTSDDPRFIAQARAGRKGPKHERSDVRVRHTAAGWVIEERPH